MICLVPQVARSFAQRRLAPGRAARLARWFVRTSKRSQRSWSVDGLPCTELVWLPYYRLSLTTPGEAVDAPDHPSSPASRRNRAVSPGDQRGSKAWLVVGGHDRSIRTVDFLKIQTEIRPDLALSPPEVDRSEAEALARHALLNAALWMRRSLAPPAYVLAACEVIAFPFWACYFERPLGSLDVALLDAIEGRPAGPKLKWALLSMLTANPPEVHPVNPAEARRDAAAPGNLSTSETQIVDRGLTT